MPLKLAVLIQTLDKRNPISHAGLSAAGVFWRRKRQGPGGATPPDRSSKKGRSGTPTSLKANGSQASPHTSTPSDGTPATLRSGMLSLLGSPPSSLVSSRNSTASKPLEAGVSLSSYKKWESVTVFLSST